MENRPVIILGGGLWGSLLALRLKKKLPQINFRLYEGSPQLGGNHTWSFHESDISPSSMEWIKPLIARSWDGHDLHFPNYSRHIPSPYHSISSKKLHEVVSQELGSDLVLDSARAISDVGEEASFVIDARNRSRFDDSGFQNFLGLEIELDFPHGLTHPILMDATVEQKDGYRFIYYLPWDSNTLLIEDTRYSLKPVADFSQFKIDILSLISEKGWKVKSILREEEGALPIPFTGPIFREEGKVINLTGIFHDTTGYSFPDAVKLVELITDSSFRFGEVKKLVRLYRDCREKDRKFFRMLNRLMFKAAENNHRYKVFEHFYRLPEPYIQKFYSGQMTNWEKARVFMGKPPVPVAKAFQIFLPKLQSPKVATQ